METCLKYVLDYTILGYTTSTWETFLQKNLQTRGAENSMVEQKKWLRIMWTWVVAETNSAFLSLQHMSIWY